MQLDSSELSIGEFRNDQSLWEMLTVQVNFFLGANLNNLNLTNNVENRNLELSVIACSSIHIAACKLETFGSRESRISLSPFNSFQVGTPD